MNVSTLPAPRRFAAVSLMITACMVWPLAACHKAPAGADEPAAKDAPGKAGAAKGGAAGGDTPAEADAPAKGGAAAALAGPVFMYWLLVHVSGVPPLEAQMRKSRGAAFDAYADRVSVFFPWPPHPASKGPA